MSIKVMSYIWEHSQAREGSLLVLLAICDFADDTGKAYPSVSTLAKKARLSERQTQYCLKSLCDIGEIKIEQNKGPHGCNLYRVQLLQGANTAGVQLATGGVQLATGGGAMDCTRTVIEPSTEPSKRNIVALSNGKAKFLDDSIAVLHYLNLKAGSSYRTVKANLDRIASRLAEGATVDDCKRVIDAKCLEWSSDAKMAKYIRPETLFCDKKFWQYEGETKVSPKPRRVAA